MADDLGFGEWIEDAYLAIGLTQGEFAAAINVGQSTVSSWVNGNSRPRRRVVPAIAKILGVPEREVIERAGLTRRTPPDFGKLLNATDIDLAEIDPRLRVYMLGFKDLQPEFQRAVLQQLQTLYEVAEELRRIRDNDVEVDS